MAYAAAAAGTVASDGLTGQRNSPYTAALLSELEKPQEIRKMFEAVGRQVLRETEDWDKGPQRPHEYGSLLRKEEGYYLAGRPEGPASGVADSVGTGRQDLARMEQETVYWESIRDSKNPEDFEAYLAKYPSGNFVDIARRRLDSLRGGAGEPSAGTVSVGAGAGAEAAARQEFDKILWEPIKESQDSADYAEYLRLHPTGAFAALARTRLQKYLEEEAWKSTLAGKGFDRYVGYLRKYPKGRFVETALSELVRNGGTGLHRAMLVGNLEMARVLLKVGVDPYVMDAYGDTPLHEVDDRSLDVARLLLEAGVDVDVRASWGGTPLHKVADSYEKDAVRFLLDAGAAVSARDKKGRTPLYYAAEDNIEWAVRLLLEAGASRSEVPEDLRSRLPK